MTARSIARNAAEQVLIRSGIERMSRTRHRDDVLILAYHNIVPRGLEASGDRSLHLPLDTFVRQLDVLARTHDVLPLHEALERPPASRKRPAAAITFDDAYAGAVTAGVSELARRGLPATIFVAPSFLDGQPFWWDVLGLDRDDLSLAERRRALTLHCGDGNRVLAEYDPGGERAARIASHARGASMLDLESAARVSGIALASHTWSHPNLTALDAPHLADELTRPLDWLRSHFDNVFPYISYPYGLSTETVERAAAEANYRAAFRINGGWLHAPPRARFGVPRVNIPGGVTLAGFRLRAAGIVSE